MRIEGLQISTFGQFQQVEFGPFSRRLTVMHGPNEAAKSTVHTFIRAMLFGFPAQPASGSEGGRLIVRDTDDRRYVIERYCDVNDGAAIVTAEGGEPVDDDVLAGLLAGASAGFYESVFTFGIGDLQSGPPLFVHAGRPEMSGEVQRQAVGALQHLEFRQRELDFAIQQADYQLAAIKHVEQRVADDQRRIARAEERLSTTEQRLAEIEHAVPAIKPDTARGAADLRKSILELRESWTRLQATRRMTDVYQETVSRQRLPRSPWFLPALMLGILLPVVLGAITGHSVVIALAIALAALGIVTLVMAAIARSRFETAQLQARLHLEMTQREVEGRFLHIAMATGIDPDNVEQEIERLEREQAAMGASAVTPLTRRDRELRRQERLGAVADARDVVAEFRRELRDTWQDWREIAAGFELPEDVRESPDRARTFIENRRAGLLVEREQIVAEIQRSPVLQAASDVFDAMTAGAYHRLVVPEGSEDVVALARDAREIPIARMGRGTREQAHLALRIGLIRAAGRRDRPLPVLVDDILTDFDPERASEAMRALDALSTDHQLILFTCHTATVALARSISPGAQVISLGEQKVPDLTPVWLDGD